MSVSARHAPRRIPATVITGFLGAGKTTLVRHLMEHAGGRRIALIINEFGDVGMDREILAACGVAGCAEDDIVELANGCICCTVADEFLPTMEALLARPQPPEHIIIETSGLALPKPLVRAFDWPDVRARVTVDGVVAVVDARSVHDGRFTEDPAGLAARQAADPALDHDNPLEEVFEDQLLCADMVVLNKVDLLSEAETAALIAELGGRLRPGTRLVPVVEGRVDPAVALGLMAGVEDDLEGRPSHHDTAIDHDHDDFHSFVVGLGAVADPAEARQRLGAVIADHDILRIKGFLAVPGKPMRHLIQAVGPRVSGYYDRPWRADEARESRLVVIGLRGLDEAAIRGALAGL
ncbi:cobalamin biosynthesis protein CobW [Rhodospirillum rubrum]|uniref:cobalamin biosynthesis protein CobW n=1 Tax=Rhodospirillum rubrum TaxID=1085 RepID=UPI001902FEDF|nr:cobalamin biosynthesis protein CobW [Rhodospirillum rubrum]MBK1663986.1 cobalamin biosynthesis protein CobW [Rhodospirillum rubrum]MBK1675456.1 cobalamin biosynthesis protein CobW [Rhodospirillum rubrum]